MIRIERVMLGAILVALFVVVALQICIYWNPKPQEEYESIVGTSTMDTQLLVDTGFFTIDSEGYFSIDEEEVYPRVFPCPICEAIQSGNITLVETLPSDNFTIIMKDNSNHKLTLYHEGLEGLIK